MSEPIYILCPYADEEYTVTGSVFDKLCSKCFKRLMLSPSGQKVLAERAYAKLICLACAIGMDLELAGATAELAGDTLANELKGVVPNTRRSRN